MASPEQIGRRVDRHEEDLRAIADTVVDIHETQQRHTETLSRHSEDLSSLRATQERHTEMLSEVLTLLRDGR